MSKESKIEISIAVDENNIPEKMQWKADDAPAKDWNETQAMMLALWDSKEQNAFRIDLWTKDMRVDEMNFFFFQTMMTLADTYQSATQNEEMTNRMKTFAEFFAEKTKIFKDKKGGENHSH